MRKSGDAEKERIGQTAGSGETAATEKESKTPYFPVDSRFFGTKTGGKSRNDTVLVAEEYPKEEEKTGFGLEDLIRKIRSEEKKRTPALREEKEKKRKPELVLIIDDVSHPGQLKAIRSLPFRITPSIFPPSQISRNSHRLARGLKHYMIHLPLESATPKMNRFAGTLFVRDSAETVRKRVEELRKLFPSGRFVNNHTGSVFTSDYKAMNRLYGDLKENGFVFLDSRTTGKSAVRRVAKRYGDPYCSRDVFLDNIQQRQAILKQLKRAVSIARKRGYAIAIGHPHRATFEALRHAEGILSGVETVYFDDFYREHYGD